MELKFEDRWPTTTGILAPASPLYVHHWRADVKNAPTNPTTRMWSTSPYNQLTPLSFAKKPKNRICIVTGREDWRSHHPDRLQLRQSPPDATGTSNGPRGQESASLSPQPFYTLFAGIQHFCSETTRRTHARGTSPPQEKIEITWRRFLGSLPVPAGRWQSILPETTENISKAVAVITLGTDKWI